jgi:PilZ domain
MSRRREKRTAVAMPILMDNERQIPGATLRSGVTLDVTSRGARVQLQSDWKIGEMIWVERQNKRAQFRVVWVGTRGAAKQQQIGIECVEPEFDWGVPLAKQDDTLPGSPEDSVSLPPAHLDFKH